MSQKIGVAWAAAVVLLVALAGAAPPSAVANTVCPGANGRIALTIEREYAAPEPEEFGSGAFTGGIGLVTAAGHARPLPGQHFDAGEGEVARGMSVSCDGRDLVYEADAGYEDTCGYLSIVSLTTGDHQAFRSPVNLCPEGRPGFLEDGRIVFSATTNRGSKSSRRPATYVADGDGTHIHKLFSDGIESNTADGRWFLSHQGHAIDLLDSKGRKVRRLATTPYGGGLASLSPNGHWAVYSRSSANHRSSGLFIVSRNGCHREKLLTTGWLGTLYPVFSPDGRWVAFVRAQPENQFHENIFAVSVAQPRRIKRLTDLKGTRIGSLAWASLP